MGLPKLQNCHGCYSVYKLKHLCLRVTSTQTPLFFYALTVSYYCNLVQDHIPVMLQLRSHLFCHLYHMQLYATGHICFRTLRKITEWSENVPCNIYSF